MEGHKTSFKSYWLAWGVLLVLTLAMLVVESAGLTRILAALFLLAAMAFKASIIGGWFMHLRLERRTIVLPLVLATLITALVLYGLIAVDAAWMQRLAE
ncbi:MAG: cytochrome C oxidase subunit IV family protein [Gemmatimonadota bacterium]